LRLFLPRATPGALLTLLRSPHIEGGTVEELDVWGLGAEHVAAILESRIAPRLRLLKLHTILASLRPNPVQLIAASPALAHLNTLALVGPVHDDAARALAASPHLPRLANIILGGRPPTAEPILRPRFGPCTIVP
jgi:hypothetical protein